MATKRKCEEASVPASSRKKGRSQTFLNSYAQLWPFLKSSKKGESFSFCEVCACDFCVAHGGRDDCRRHVASQKHCDYAKLKSQNYSVASFLKPSSASDSLDLEVTRAEAMMVDMLIELNLPISAADTMTKACKAMFKNPEVVKKFSCGRTKATAMVKEMSYQTQNHLVDVMKSSPFTVSTDGSNDRGSVKLFPLVIRVADLNSGEVRSDVLSVKACEGSATGEAIFGLMNEEFRRFGIPWSNCIALGSDNANVMVGMEKGVYGFIRRVHPSTYLAGCVCHLIHLAAEKGAACISLNVDQMLIDVFYYLNKSSKRQAALQSLQQLHEVKVQKIMKHVSTRWLSINYCLPRILESWEALLSFFKDQEKEAVSSAEKERVGKMRKIFQSPTNRLYCYFLQDVLGVFDAFNTEFQSSEPKVHILQRRLNRLLWDLLVRFVKPSALMSKAAHEVQIDNLPHIVKDAADIITGEKCAEFMENKARNNLREERISDFQKDVKQFFMTSTKYLQKKLPLKCEVLRHAEVADPSLQLSNRASSLKFFLARYPCLVPHDCKPHDLLLEYAKYQSTDISFCIKERADKTWNAISLLKDENGDQIFKHLPTVMLNLLTIPHSSAHCERIFSVVRKNQTDFRPNLGVDTLEALLVTKSRAGSAVDRTYSRQNLVDLKSSCYRSLHDTTSAESK